MQKLLDYQAGVFRKAGWNGFCRLRRLSTLDTSSGVVLELQLD